MKTEDQNPETSPSNETVTEEDYQRYQWYLAGRLHAYKRASWIGGIVLAFVAAHLGIHFWMQHKINKSMQRERTAWQQTLDHLEPALQQEHRAAEQALQAAERCLAQRQTTETEQVAAEDQATVLRLAREARAIVRDAPSPPNTWHWDEVRQVVADVGSDRLPVEVRHQRAEGRARRQGQEMWIELSDRLRTASAEEVANVLVHEASHIVFFRLFGNAVDGTVPTYQPGYQPLCPRDALDVNAATEALSYLNEFRWMRMDHRRQIGTIWDLLQHFESAIQGCERSDLNACMRFASFAYTYALDGDPMEPRGPGPCRHPTVNVSSAYPAFFTNFVAIFTLETSAPSDHP